MRCRNLCALNEFKLWTTSLYLSCTFVNSLTCSVIIFPSLISFPHILSRSLFDSCANLYPDKLSPSCIVPGSHLHSLISYSRSLLLLKVTLTHTSIPYSCEHSSNSYSYFFHWPCVSRAELSTRVHWVFILSILSYLSYIFAESCAHTINLYSRQFSSQSLIHY